MKKIILTSLCMAGVMTISGCATVADMAGADTATLNAQATQSYNKMVTDARSKNQLDTSSSTYKRINTVFLKLRPICRPNEPNGSSVPMAIGCDEI